MSGASLEGALNAIELGPEVAVFMSSLAAAKGALDASNSRINVAIVAPWSKSVCIKEKG